MAKKSTRNTRGRIVSAAWKLFYEQGYEDTTVEEIIELSGTSKGSFYHYFDGKDALLSTLSSLFDEKYEELTRLIQERLDRGTTLVYTQTGYLKNDQPMILTVVSNRELMRLNQIVQEIDPHAFMIIGNVNEVRGRGFSTQKVYKNEVGMNE